MDVIASFTGEYRFLSNFYPCKLTYCDRDWHSAENAYQAMKSSDTKVWSLFREISPAASKQLGKKIEIRADWDEVKPYVMRNIVHAKFAQNELLRKKLLHTGDHELIEGNDWGDRYWGQSPLGTGRNELGKILMEVRDSSFETFFY